MYNIEGDIAFILKNFPTSFNLFNSNDNNLYWE